MGCKTGFSVDFSIKKGFDLPLAGRPASALVDLPLSDTVAVYPLEFSGIRQRLLVEEGDEVAHGAALLEDKGNAAFKLRAPAGGTVTSIQRGARRFVEKIVIQVNDRAERQDFGATPAGRLLGLDRQDVLNRLTASGYLTLVRQRPFSKMADVDVIPEHIFVNAMNTAPFDVDAEVVAAADPEAFQAGLDVMTRLTPGEVNLCVGAGAGAALSEARRVSVHRFSGPHPAGNTSVHIARLAPMAPTDIIWTVKAADLVPIGRLFLDGTLPHTRIISLGGPGVSAEACRHYRLRMGGDLKPLFDTALEAGEHRIVGGHALAGHTMPVDSHLQLHDTAITVIPEDPERHFMGWTMPGLDQMSFSRLFASTWLKPRRSWRLGTNLHGEERALVLTGHYNKVMPLDIMVDFLVRAVLAGDTDEAIALGILETDPEDFALCDVICPSKIEVQEIIRNGLRQIEEEGL